MKTNLTRFLALILAVLMTAAMFAACNKDEDTGSRKKKAEADVDAEEEIDDRDLEEPILDEDGRAEIAFITDAGQLMDHSFNQETWRGCKRYAKANRKTVNYYQPANGANATDADHFNAMEAAINNGAKVVVASGFMQAIALAQAASAHPDTKFIFVDGWPLTDGDWNVLENVAAIAYREEQGGYLAGYAAVMEGYTKLGFCGGGGGYNPACCRYGYGFVQGAEAAAAVKNVDVEINYSWEYGMSFSPSPELQSMTSGWYKNGTEVIFVCGGSMFYSVSAAAEANGKKVIGVDVDQSYASDTVVTSAMKNIPNSVVWALGKYYEDKWSEIGGISYALGAADDAVCLPTATWSLKNWAVNDYKALLNDMKTGAVTVDPYYPDDMGSFSGAHVTITMYR